MARRRKNRKQRRAEQQAAAPAVAPAPAEPPLAAAEPPRADPDEQPAADLDADLDGGVDSYESLVAAVAEMPEAADRPLEGADREVEPVHDLDDEDAAAAIPGSVQGLIAQAGREAPPAGARTRATDDEADEDVPVIDLDADLPAVAVPRGPRGAVPQANPDVSRLARAAAAGAVDDEPRAIPLDLFGDISTPEARARLLAEALAHAEHKEARYRVPLGDTQRAARWKGAVAAVLLMLAGTVAVSPPDWVRPEPAAQLSDAARARGIRVALMLQAHQIEAYRVQTQQLPSSLEDLPMTLPGMRYTRSARSYQLVAFTPGGDPVVYDGADPSPPFRVLAGALAAGEAP